MAHQDTGAVEAPVHHTVDSAAAALSSVFQSEPEEEQIEDEGEDPNVNDEIADDDFTEEVEEVEGEEADEQDEPEEPAIEAPVSLKADEKEEFSQLPKEAQDFVTRLEQRRNADVQNVTTKAAEAQRQAEATAANAKKEADALMAQRVKAVAEAYAPQAPNPAHYQSIEQFQRAQMQYEHDRAQHDELMQQVGQIGVETDEMRAERIQARDKALMEIPEVANEETRGEYIDKAMKMAEELGYDVADLAENMDAGDLKALAQAAQWKADSEELARIRAKSKERKRDPKTGKYRSLKPGAAQPRKGSSNRALDNAKQRLARTGSLDDAQAALKAIL